MGGAPNGGTIAMADPSPAIDAFLNKHSIVKALPENMTRILRMASDKECDINQLLKLISQDAALAGSIMKAVNSAFYSLQTKVTRLDRAVTFMGLRAVKEITVSSCFSTMCKPVQFGKYDARDLWDHSVGVAIMARELAIRSEALDPEEAFLAGMMHDLALLLALQSEVKLGTTLIDAAEGSDEPFTAHEQRVFGFNHCELGERLSTNWSLAPQLISVIRWHHDQESAPAEHLAMVRHIHLADTLCCQATVGFPLTCASQQLTDEMFEKANLTREIATEVSAKLPVLLRLHLG
jgi:HD-like signal output (HDOD) protein